MDYPQYIRDLLQKYWNAETTLEEERQLKDFMAHAENGDSGELAYFSFLQNEASLTAKNVAAKRVRMDKGWSILRIARIAAAVLFVVAAGWAIQQSFDPPVPSEGIAIETIEDPMEAYAEAKQALLFVSQKLNQTQTQTSAQLQKIRPYTEIIK